MPSNLITTLFSICVGFAIAMIILLAPPMISMKIDLATVARNAAKTAAVSANTQDVENQINLDLQTEHLPTTWTVDNQTVSLFTVTQVSTPSAGQTGYSETNGPGIPTATVTVQYNAPLPFDRALTLFGGPVLPMTIPMTETASYYNEDQYTGADLS